MANREIALAAALAAFLLSSCGGPKPASAENSAAAVEADVTGNVAPSAPVRPNGTADAPDDPVPPPDAISHPDGYLPPAPAEPGAASADPSAPDPPATEDEYIRNRQSGL